MAKVLVVGGGGRCHAIVHALSKSSKVSQIYAAPGNPGFTKLATLVNIKVNEIDKLLAFALENKIDLTIVGPEEALALGIVDKFRENGLKIFGPTKKAANIESSKDYAKALMKKYNIPTASYQTFSDYNEAREYITKVGAPIVLKYDGLAAGKGVVVALTLEEAYEALDDMLLEDKYGHGKVVIEECLEGPEFSFMALVNNENVYPLALAQDHKRAYDNDLGPNTGGMGTYSPLPFVTDADYKYSLNEIMKKTAKALVDEGNPFTGVLYGGLMKTKDGIKVIEFNARFGDPETEVVLPRLSSDFYEAINNVCDNKEPKLEWISEYVLGIVMASKGYPNEYEKGHIISGNVDENTYHMGTSINDGKLITNGGRVLIVTGKGKTLEEANENAKARVREIKCDNLFYRNDIGAKAYKY